MKEWFDELYFKNRERWAGLKARMDFLFRTIQQYHPKTVLDVGCGTGFLVAKLRRGGVEAWGMDWTGAAGKLIPDWYIIGDATQRYPFADQSFDVVISTDVFEHLPPDSIDQTRDEMLRVGKVVLASIGFTPEHVFAGEKMDTHLTVRPRHWWEAKIAPIKVINKP